MGRKEQIVVVTGRVREGVGIRKEVGWTLHTISSKGVGVRRRVGEEAKAGKGVRRVGVKSRSSSRRANSSRSDADEDDEDDDDDDNGDDDDDDAVSYTHLTLPTIYSV